MMIDDAVMIVMMMMIMMMTLITVMMVIMMIMRMMMMMMATMMLRIIMVEVLPGKRGHSATCPHRSSKSIDCATIAEPSLTNLNISARVYHCQSAGFATLHQNAGL